MAQPNLVTLNAVDLTDQGRTLAETREEKFTELELANGSIMRYYKATKHKWDLSWKWLPGPTNKTYDNRGARDSIYTIVQAGVTVPFVLRHSSDASPTNYTVFVDSYSEDIVRRDPGCYYYTVKLSLKEQ